MKYEFKLTIEKQDNLILSIEGNGSSKDEKTTLKIIQHDINKTLKERIKKLEINDE